MANYSFNIVEFVRQLVDKSRYSANIQAVQALPNNQWQMFFGSETTFEVGSLVDVTESGILDAEDVKVISVSNEIPYNIVLQYVATNFNTFDSTIITMDNDLLTMDDQSGITVLGNVVKNIPTFFHFEAWEADTTLQELSNTATRYPIAGLIEPLRWTDVIKQNGQIDVNFNLQMVFVNNANYYANTNQTSDYHNRYIMPMTLLAYAFVQQVYRLENVDNNTIRANVETFKNYRQTATKLAGVLCNIQFTVTNCKSIC